MNSINMSSGYSEGKTGMLRLGNISIYKELNVTFYVEYWDNEEEQL